MARHKTVAKLEMPYAEECERPFYVTPSNLFKLSFGPSVACASNSINALIRGSVLMAVVCAIASISYGATIFVFGFVVIAALYGPSLYATLIGGASEGFQAELLKIPPVVDQSVNVIGCAYTQKATKPSARNPFMNVLLDEIKYNPTRPPAEDINDPLVKTQLDDFFRIQWSSDPTDVFGRSQSQREFYTVPSTSIPNDQESYQNWLYKIPGLTCKEGGRTSCVAENNSPLVSNWVGS